VVAEKILELTIPSVVTDGPLPQPVKNGNDCMGATLTHTKV
jgi:hypothetical protein